MPSKHRQIAFLFEEADHLDKNALGGKGAGLVDMTKLGMPIPPGFIVLTGVSRAFSQEEALPQRLHWQLHRCIRALEKKQSKAFGGDKPLLVSVRSGAKVSMPGMMDTVLNLGLNEQTVKGLIHETGDQYFAYDTYARFLESFGTTVLGVEKGEFAKIQACSNHLQSRCYAYRRLIVEKVGHMVDDPFEQLVMAIIAVCRSWQSERAVAYRKAHGLPHNWGTAVVVQAMVFGNSGIDSGTGVVFSRNVATGDSGLYGEYLSDAQGEDIVAGIDTPQTIASLAVEMPSIHRQLSELVERLERHYNDVVDVEFTVEHGQLYLLQSRVAKRTPIAAVRIAVDMVREKRWRQKEAVSRIGEDILDQIGKDRFDPEALAAACGRILSTGIAASGGAAVGQAVFCPRKAQEWAKSGKQVILFREETSPDDFAGMLAANAIVTSRGGATSHAAVVARGLGRPAVVGTQDLAVNEDCIVAKVGGKFVKVYEGDFVSVDGDTGTIILGRVPMVQSLLDEKVETFRAWKDAHAPKRPGINPSLLEQQFCVNTLLNDFYISDALRHASSGDIKREATKLHAQITQLIAELFATYLLIAVGGELRYTTHKKYNNDAIQGEIEQLNAHGIEHGPERREIQLRVIKKLSALSTKHQAEFLKTAVKVFSADGWSGSFGGQKWAVIADTLLQYLQSSIPMALFVDRVFDLRHNSDRLFDKHPFVRDLTDESYLQAQLNAKRKCTGGVKQLVEQLGRYDSRMSPKLKQLYTKWVTSQENQGG